MSAHEMANKMADIDMSRRDYRSGSLYQRTSDWRWIGSVDAGFTSSGSRKRVAVTGPGCEGGCKERCHHRSAMKRKIQTKVVEIKSAKHGPSKRTVTVAKWSTEWLELIQPQVSPNAYNTDKAAARVIVAAIGAKRLSALEPADVRLVAKAVRSKGLSTSTALRYQGALMRMLKAAVLDGYAIQPNVFITELAKAAVNDRTSIPIPKAIGALEYIASLPQGSRWAITFLQGHRQGESLGLTWPEIDLDAGTLRISWQLQTLNHLDKNDPDAGFEMPDGYEARRVAGAYHLVRPKSEAGWRTQPLVSWAVGALRAWREVAPENPHQLVWPGPTTKGVTWPRNPANDRGEWYAMQKHLDIWHPEGVTKKRPHGRFFVHEIRHTTATLLLELGVPESVRIAILGHSTVASTKAYEHVDLALARAALEQAAERLALR